MKSKASIKSHPIHPALIPFPFAFLFGAFLFDLAGVVLARPGWWATGMHLAVAGIAAALLAAVPGVIDYIHTVPPKSSAKTRATKHGIVNLSSVALFATSALLRGDSGVEPSALILVLEAAGAGLLAAGGWMGGVLVSRNQISVDPRYAAAGKWNEQSVEMPADGPAVVAKTDELETDQMKLLHVGERRIVLAKAEKDFVAFDDRCTHKGGSLAGGAMICGTVQCPWHGSQFDTRTGAVCAGPAKTRIETYGVDVAGKDVRLARPGGGK